jgi:eukaryotic-like serine/threonine-protein kinase
METMAYSQKCVEDLFEAALARPQEERRAFLDAVCPDSPGLRQRVEVLLQADDEAGSFLESPVLSTSDIHNRQPCAAFEPGCVICDRFHIHRFIACGGMGEVYEAWDSGLKERVAIKTIRPELAQHDDALERFKREVKQARAISHPNVCRIHELFCHISDSGTRIWFLSMEYLDGFTLSEHIHHLGPIKAALALDLTEQIVSGLTAAHKAGVIHRDLKSGNIMLVNTATGHLRAVITDFGLSLNVFQHDGNLAEPGGQGTPAYMAPEQEQTGVVSALADQYALGVILCEMLTGSRPARKDATAARQQLQATLSRKAGLRWSRVVLRCLEHDPKNRYQNLNEIIPALKPVKQTHRAWTWSASVASLAVLIAIGLSHRARPAPAPTSLAVLPLENHTGDASLDYVGAGITEALTDDLARMPRLQVAAGSIARRFQGPQTDPASAGRQMHVASVLSGFLENSRGRLKVPIEVIDANTGRELWGQTYEARSADFVNLQHQISTDVAYHLQVQADPGTTARLKRQYSTNSETYNNYLKGRYQLVSRSPESLREAVVDFQRALSSDDHYAPAYAGLADSYSLLAFYGLEKPKPVLTQAIDASQHALELDSTLGEAYSSRALARTLLNFDWQGAEEDYKRAIELNPNYLQAHTSYALLLLAPQGRLAEARAQMAYAQAADPDSVLTIVGLAMLEQYAGNFDRSIRILEPHMVELDMYEPAIEILAVDYLAKHNTAKAIQILSASPSTPESADTRQTMLAVAYALAGQTSKAEDLASRVKLQLNQGHALAYDASVLYTALNDREKALDMLNYAFDQRESNLVWVNVDPLLTPLRVEPRFHELTTEMNLQ